MRSAFQEKLWEALDRQEPEPIKDWLIFDGYEPEIEEEYGTVYLDEETCREVVRKVTGIEPIEACYDKTMNGIEYKYEEVDDEYNSH